MTLQLGCSLGTGQSAAACSVVVSIDDIHHSWLWSAPHVLHFQPVPLIVQPSSSIVIEP
jgi:hypothetical protein